MKKIRILAVILAFAVLFVTGCGAGAKSAKVEPIDGSVSNFFNEAINEFGFISAIPRKPLGELETTDIVRSYNTEMGIFISGGMTWTNLISALDFYIEINKEGATEGMTQKIYEYQSSYLDKINEILNSQMETKTFVCVIKEQGKSNVFKTQQYTVGKDQKFEAVLGATPDCENKFTISKGRGEGIYECTDSSNKVSSRVIFDSANGYLGIEINQQVNYLGLTVINIEQQIDFYNYTNNTVGGRSIASAKIQNEKYDMIFEFLCKEFEKRGKFGTIKDKSIYEDMSLMNEEKIGCYNEGDGAGYIFSYNDTKNGMSGGEVEITASLYGIRN